MSAYRLYCLDRDGNIGTAEWFDAADDAEAIKKAHDMKPQALKCEVWQETRLVASLDAHNLASCSPSI